MNTPEPKHGAVLVVNTHSRRGQAAFEEARRHLTENGISLSRAVACGKRGEMESEVKRALKAQVPVVIAGGGDGTLSGVANLLIGSETVMGVLPLGTGNSFARDLGISVDLAKACEVVGHGKVAHVDVGMANGACFLNVATVGLSTGIASLLQESMKRKFGRFVYVYAVARAFRHIKPFTATLKTENGSITFPTLQIVIGNGRYHAGPFKVAPDASLTTGKLSLYALESASKTSLLKLALHLPSGTQGILPEVHSESTAWGELTSTSPRKVTVDGEIASMTPLKFEVRAGALRVVVPLDFPG